MCAIIGEVNVIPDEVWVNEQIEQALKRGKDLTHYSPTTDVHLWHTRLATNDSEDTYPIIIDGDIFAMNGIISEKVYKELMKEYTDTNGYSVDSAYFLRLWLDKQDWSLFDTDNFVFAFWLLEGDDLYLGNKDFPLFINKDRVEGLRFSSFDSDGFKPLGNKVVKYNIVTDELTELYEFKDLVYAQ